jgi:aspartate aminotransferase/aminotransferase
MSINFDLLKPSASMEVTKLAGELKQQGKKVFPLSAGDTHFAPPQAILKKMNNLPAAYSHYTNAEGIIELRQLIARQLDGFMADDVVLVPGLKQGLYYALSAIAGKRLCILEPAWLGYEATAVMAGYTTCPVNTYLSDWTTQLAQLQFDVIIICSPNNPDGKILDANSLQLIRKAAEKNDAWIITDYIYDSYCFEGDTSAHNLLLDYAKLIIGNGFSKSHAMTGFRAGYVLCKNKTLRQRMIVMQQNLATCVPAISQYALTGANDALDEIKNNAAYYRNNRDLVLSFFPLWHPFTPQGGFYYFIDLGIYGIDDSQTFCKKLLAETGVALVPGGAYGKGFERYVRLSFSIDKEQLAEGLQLMKNFIDENY